MRKHFFCASKQTTFTDRLLEKNKIKINEDKMRIIMSS